MEIEDPDAPVVHDAIAWLEQYVGVMAPVVLLVGGALLLLSVGYLARPSTRAKHLSRQVPRTFTKYRETKVFNQDTVPDALKRAHNTRKGVWGKLRVISGKLNLRYLLDPDRGQLEEVITLTAGTSNSIAGLPPQAMHQVELDGQVEFLVEFYRKADETGPAGPTH